MDGAGDLVMTVQKTEVLLKEGAFVEQLAPELPWMKIRWIGRGDSGVLGRREGWVTLEGLRGESFFVRTFPVAIHAGELVEAVGKTVRVDEAGRAFTRSRIVVRGFSGFVTVDPDGAEPRFAPCEPELSAAEAPESERSVAAVESA